MKSASRGDRLIRLPTSEGSESDPTSENGGQALAPQEDALCVPQLAAPIEFQDGVEMQ